MTRLLALLTIAVALIATAQPSRAQVDDPDALFGGAPHNKLFQFFSGGYAGSTTRTTVNFASNQKPGSIFINTAERRLYGLGIASGAGLILGLSYLGRGAA